MNELTDYKQKIIDLCDRVYKISENTENANAKIFKENTDKILSKKNPSIMFYGLYNARKSTIINAIFGEEIAETGDVPTTYKIQRIPWENFIIIDTPGINAKNEHTLTADSEICLHDIILFVIDDMNIEERSFYTAFIKVLKSGKPVIIVINEKNAEDESLENSPRIKKLKLQMIENIRFAGNTENISEIEKYNNFYGIIAVNAMTAYYSKQLSGDESQLLYNESGFPELLMIMQDILKKSEGIKTMIPVFDVIKNHIAEIELQIKNSTISENAKKYIDMMKQLMKQKNNLYQRLAIEGKQQIMMYGDTISQSQQYHGDINQILNNIIKKGFTDANITISQQFDFYKVKTDFDMNFSQTDFSLDMSLPDTHDSQALNFPDISPIYKTSTFAQQIPWTQILVFISEIIKGKRKADEEKCQQMREYKQAVAENNRLIEQKINETATRIIEANQKIRSELYRLENSYLEYVSQIVEDYFEPLIKDIEKKSDEQNIKKETFESYISELHEILSEIVKLECDIKD